LSEQNPVFKPGMKTSPGVPGRNAGRGISVLSRRAPWADSAIPHGDSMPFQFVHVTERAQACLMKDPDGFDHDAIEDYPDIPIIFSYFQIRST